MHNDAAGTLHLHTEAEIAHPIVVIASERTDDDPGGGVGIGELVRIRPDLTLTREIVITEKPARPMDLSGHPARTQSYERD